MISQSDTERDDGVSFSRRDILRTVGTAGALSALGAESGTAKKPKRYIVGTKPGRANVAKRKANKVDKVIDFDDIGQAVLGKWPEQALNGLRNNPHVRYVEEESVGHTTQEELPWGIDRVDAEIAHDNGDTGNGADIGIVDTGIDLDHPDLVGNLADPNDSNEHSAFVNCNDSSVPVGDCLENWDDDDSHGTHVAGIAAAIDNAEDVIGVATESTLHAIKVCDDTGSCPCGDVADGIRDAADNGYEVANVSIGGCGGSAVEDAVDYAENNGTIVVASAGNAGPCTDCVSAPGRFANSIAVSSTTDTDTLSGFSSQGDEVDIAAPGGSPAAAGAPHPGRAILSTINDGGTGVKWGTSMAAPHVAGAVAQLRANGVSQSNVRTVLENTADDIGLTDNEQGWGLLDVAEVLGHGSANDLLEVETDFATGLEWTEAQLNGQLTQLTGSANADVYFEWGPAGGGFPHSTPGTNLASTGFFSETVTGLEEDTEYQFRAVTTNAEGSTERGEPQTFFTEDNLDPNAAITHAPTIPNVGDTVDLDASGSDDGDFGGDSIVSYEWDLDDDGAFDDATGPTATTTYSSGGSKTVKVRVTDEFDQTDVAATTFTVNEFPTASFTHSPTEPNEGESTTFDASGSSDPDGSIVSYEWDWDYDGSTFTVDESTTSSTTNHTFSTFGDKTVALRVTDDNGATDTTSQTFHVNGFPTASFTVSPDPVVRNEAATFDATGSSDPDGTVDLYEWDWDYDGAFTADESTASPTATHTFTTGGEHTVALRVTDDDGATSDPATTTFTVHIRVAINIQPNGTGPNSINPNSKGRVPVAVLHTSAFDPTARLDPETVHFGDPDDVGFDASDTPEGGATPAHAGGHVEDVDDDGDVDSLFHFPNADAGFESDDTEGELVGTTDDGVPVFATDDVNIVGGGKP